MTLKSWLMWKKNILKAIGRVSRLLGSDDGCQREAVADALGHTDDVRSDAVAFKRPEMLAGPSETRLDLPAHRSNACDGDTCNIEPSRPYRIERNYANIYIPTTLHVGYSQLWRGSSFDFVPGIK